MPIIKPISDLRNKANEISELVHKSQQPVFITKNGEGDMVVMSIAHYSRLQTKIELLTKLGVAQSQLASGEKGRTLRQVMSGVCLRRVGQSRSGLETSRANRVGLGDAVELP